MLSQIELNAREKTMLKIKKVNIEVSPFEMAIIDRLRKIEYGNIVIEIKEGFPYRIEYKKSEILFSTPNEIDLEILNNFIERK